MDDFDRVDISASSPDRSVTIRAAGSPATISVDIARGTFRSHSEASMEQQINGAVRIAIRAYQQAITRAWRTTAGLEEEPE